MIDIHQAQCERLALALPMRIKFIERLIEGAAIGQAGQSIGAGFGEVVGNLMRLRFQTLLSRVESILEVAGRLS